MNCNLWNTLRNTSWISNKINLQCSTKIKDVTRYRYLWSFWPRHLYKSPCFRKNDVLIVFNTKNASFLIFSREKLCILKDPLKFLLKWYVMVYSWHHSKYSSIFFLLKNIQLESMFCEYRYVPEKFYMWMIQC